MSRSGLTLLMSVSTFEGVVENGQIKIPKDLQVPDHTRVYVVIPDSQPSTGVRVMSPRLANPEQAKDFKMTILPNAGV